LSIGSTLDRMFAALEQAAPIAALRESTYAFPLVNALHIIGIALLFGSIVALDLRLLGWRRDAGPAENFTRLLVPVAIGGLLIAIPAGLLMFATDARAYAASPLFQAKMVVVALAIANALWLRAAERSRAAAPSRTAFAAVASILLWLAAILLGRLLGYF
jgi:uncharacterized membrane protein SirB2